MVEITSAQKKNCNIIIQKISFSLKRPCLIELIAAETTKAPVKNKDRQSNRNSPIENGNVKIVIARIIPKTKIRTYAGI
jgi:hypothetical protein